VPSEVAEDLVQRMVAERISRKLIRLFGPESIFPVLKHVSSSSNIAAPIPAGPLAPIELPGLHLEFPKNCEGVSMASVRAGWDWSASA